MQRSFISGRKLHVIDILNIRIGYTSSGNYFLDHALNLEISMKDSYYSYSYTKYCRLKSFINRNKSFMKILKSRGPRMDP